MNKICLVVIPGFGIANNKMGNLILKSNTPNLDKWKNGSSVLKTDISYGDVAVVSGIGASYENILWGRKRVRQNDILTRKLETGDLYISEKLKEVFKRLKKQKKALHIVGNASESPINGNYKHIEGILEIAKRNYFEDVYIHLITDRNI